MTYVCPPIETQLRRRKDMDLDWFMCRTCGYYSIRDGIRYCGRRQRQMRWNPTLFFCGDYVIDEDKRPEQMTMDDRW